MITLSDTAKLKIKELISQEAIPDTKLRIFVQGGGCSGMQYGFTFDNKPADDDYEIQFDGYSILIDSISSLYLQNSQINWDDNLMGSSFKIENPNATTSCGCGSSFSID